MGILRGEENRNDNNSRKINLKVDSSDVATQQIDSQISLDGDLEGNGADDFLYLTSTMPVDDAYLFEDEFEAQMMNLAGETQMVDLAEETQMVDLAEETQMVDLAEETQIVDLAEETQVVDLAGETQVVNIAGETQVLDDVDCLKTMPIEFNAEAGAVSECEETNTTNVMCETQEVSQYGSVKNGSSDSIGLKSPVDKDPSREGPVCRGFTSIRAASIRASGLAAHAGRANSNLCTTSSDKSSLEKETCEQNGSSAALHSLKSDRTNDRECLENENNDNSEKLRSSNKCKVGCAAVRQLFREDEDDGVGDSETDSDHTDNNVDVPEQIDSENCLAGLSYANSQEPGELSQAHALEVVDKFLDFNFMEYDESFGRRVHKAEKPKVVSAAKGSRDLAKSSILKSTAGDCGIYDWDDTREDDGGGDFFVKKKELFFHEGGPKQRCLTQPRKSRGPGNLKTVEDNQYEKESKFAKNKLGDPMCSDSGLMLRKLRSKGKSLHCGEEVLQKNLVKNLDEQLHMVSGPKLTEDTDNDVPDMRNIGPDTQMAAEAMETLCFEMNLADSNDGGPDKDVHITGKAAKESKLRNKTVHSKKTLASKVPCANSVGVVTRQAKRTKRISIGTSNESSVSPKPCKTDIKKRGRVQGEAEEGRLADVNNFVAHGTKLTGQRSNKKHVVEDQLDFYVPVVHRTQKSIAVNRSKVAANSNGGKDVINDVISASVCGKRAASKDKNPETVSIEKVRKVGPSGFKQPNRTCVDTSGASTIDSVDNLRGKRSRKSTSADRRYSERLKRSSEVPATSPVNPDTDKLNNSSAYNDPALQCLETQSKKIISHRTFKTRSSRNNAAQCDFDHLSAKTNVNNAVSGSISKQGHENRDDGTSVEGAERTGRQEASPRGRTSSSNCATPANCTTPINSVSPVCMGDEYHKQSCRKSWSKLSLLKEIEDLVTGSPGPYGGMRESRKRKDITAIKVLFSQHLDVDVVKQQKKILARLGGAVASSMSDATHFVADEFARTRNMLEAIASGKPVVTHLWIESCGQASCLIDERNYILRDARKEKEFGFCLPVSLARACQHPLLQGQKVLITPNTKPGKEVLANLVKAVKGLATERLGRSVLNDKKFPDDLLILSCEEDYEACVPLLEKGAAVYSSELLLNGIVKQKLEYERHRLFVDHVRRTRSTIWVKKNNKFLPVTT